MKLVQTLVSQLDASVNFIFKGDFPGYLEARYVRRAPNYVVCYLSSQSGCRQGCNFCHLTKTGQTSLIDVDISGYETQIDTVLNHYSSLGNPAKTIHFGLMSRGSALANQYFVKNNQEILRMMAEKALQCNLFPRYTVSTILPKIIKGKNLADLFPVIHPDFYYSIYSMDPVFRKKWLPNALPAEEGLDLLKDWQNKTKKIPKLHWAFIQNENDSQQNVEEIANAVSGRNLRVDINIIRYNPPDAASQEATIAAIDTNVALLKKMLPSSMIKVVARVGEDVFASCGTFIPK